MNAPGTPERLREQCQIALDARAEGGPLDSRWFSLVMRLAVRLGVNPNRVVAEIERLAE